ncbi:SDR family oxidoreductase [Ascidiimonas aurantiaca]|uniref:SDR family NAD(P)-dependent oxidoreductase n=1 Tax=Ascidiimonas aurantiaca TaxID=1685432 RepID=UPI0030EB380C
MKKNILLVGGSYGIGHAIADLLSQDHKIYIASRSYDHPPKSNIVHVPYDVNKHTSLPEVIPQEIHGFVFCPGSINLRPFKMLSVESFKEDIQINFINMVTVLKEVLPRMAQGSSIVLFSTVAVQTGMPFHTSVAAAKGAIEGFARSLAAEYAPKIRVNVIAPSLTDTPLAEKLLNNDVKKEKMSARHPLKRYGSPEDIANAAVFLLEETAAWITGQIIHVDGGISSLNLN